MLIGHLFIMGTGSWHLPRTIVILYDFFFFLPPKQIPLSYVPRPRFDGSVGRERSLSIYKLVVQFRSVYTTKCKICNSFNDAALLYDRGPHLQALH